MLQITLPPLGVQVTL
jgi:hypothetical protein